MDIQHCTKASFCVIGKEGTTQDGEGFIGRLWDAANAGFHEVVPLAKVDAEGNIAGFWGAMSDFSLSFRPWELGFSQGRYLAGVEANDDAAAPAGWTKWVIPGYEYLYVKVESDAPGTFSAVIAYMQEHALHLAGAVHDFICPHEAGQAYMFFPIRKL